MIIMERKDYSTNRNQWIKVFSAISFVFVFLSGAAYEFIWSGDMSVNQERGPLAGRVSGDYRNTNMSFFALNLSWKF